MKTKAKAITSRLSCVTVVFALMAIIVNKVEAFPLTLSIVGTNVIQGATNTVGSVEKIRTTLSTLKTKDILNLISISKRQSLPSDAKIMWGDDGKFYIADAAENQLLDVSDLFTYNIYDIVTQGQQNANTGAESYLYRYVSEIFFDDGLGDSFFISGRTSESWSRSAADSRNRWKESDSIVVTGTGGGQLAGRKFFFSAATVKAMGSKFVAGPPPPPPVPNYAPSSFNGKKLIIHWTYILSGQFEQSKTSVLTFSAGNFSEDPGQSMGGMLYGTYTYTKTSGNTATVVTSVPGQFSSHSFNLTFSSATDGSFSGQPYPFCDTPRCNCTSNCELKYNPNGTYVLGY